MSVTKPTIGQQNWGPILNAALDALDTSVAGKLDASTASGTYVARGHLFLYPEDYGAVGDGVTDDSAAFTAAFAAGVNVMCKMNKTYVVGNVIPPANAILDLNGSTLKRKSGSRNAVQMLTYRSVLKNGTVTGGGSWVATTASAGAAAAATAITVTSSTGMVAGMKIFYQSAWADGGVEVNEIASIAGTTVNLVFPLKGTLTINAKVLADFALIESSGAFTKYGTYKDLLLTEFLVGVQTGGEGTAASNAFTKIDGLAFADFVGCAIYLGPNCAAEDFSRVRVNGAKTLTSNFTGNAVTVRFAIPYNLRKQVDRWGAEPSIRLIVGGVTKTATTDYTIDLGTWEVVATVAPGNGVAVQVINYEYSAFGIVGRQSAVLGPDSIERISSSVVIACRIGMWLDNCELGFISNMQIDNGYIGALLTNCRDIHFRGCDFLYSAFAVVIDGSCINVSLNGFSTTLVPDADEFAATASKKEVTVRSGATLIGVDRNSWSSKSSYTESIASGTSRVLYAPRVQTAARVYSNVAQSLPNNATTLITWELESYDTATLHSTTVNTDRITVPAGFGGIWHVDFSVSFSYAFLGSQRAANVLVNGATVGAFNTPPLDADTRVAGAMDITVAAGDYIGISAYNGGGGALTLVAAFNTSWLAAHYVGPTT